VCAVLRGVKFTDENYKSFIDLQDKIHHNLGRRRTLVSIGTHDLKTITPPFIYKAEAPENIKFVALNKTESTTAPELFTVLSQEIHLKPFLKILENEPLYPVIYDSEHRVLSLPPIINGDHSKITLDTRDVFIEITATDLTKAKIALDVITTAFSLYTETKFAIESVNVEGHDGQVVVTP
jgi:phenylalanyl-tRNA synthetase beta chain